MKKQSFITRLRSIDRATDKLEVGATPEDVTYLIEHLAFTAELLVHGGHFPSSDQKKKLHRALYTAQNAAAALRAALRQENA